MGETVRRKFNTRTTSLAAGQQASQPEPPWGAFPRGTSGVVPDDNAFAVNLAVRWAVSVGDLYCEVPASHIPYNPNLVAFNPAVRMTVEGFNPGVYHVDAYGAAGDGLTDDTTVIKTAIAGAAGKALVTGTPGKVYSIGNGYAGLNTAADSAKLLGVVGDNAILDFTGCTLKYGGSANDANGSDNNGQSLVAFLGSNGVFRGTIDCANKFRWGLGSADIKAGLRFDCTIINAREPGTWSSLWYVQTVDMTGYAVTTRASNVSGTLKRPSCPYSDNGEVINGHYDATAVINGGATAYGNCTGNARVQGPPSTGNRNASVECRPDAKGVPQFGFPADTNAHYGDAAVYDLSANVLEGLGASAAASAGWGLIGTDTLGVLAKNGSSHIYGHGNLGSDGSSPSLVEIVRAAGQADIDLDYNPAGGLAGGRMVHKQTSPAEAVLVSGIDCRNQDQVFITLTAPRLVGAPLNPRKGQRLAMKLKQGGAGGFGLTFNAVFTGFVWSNAGNVTGALSTIDWLFDGTNWSPISPQTAWSV